MVPTVLLVLEEFTFCSIAIAGEIPLISSISGFSILPKNNLAYELRLSMYLLWPSAYRVSNASEDFPDPETPVKTVNLFLGIETLMFFKLCTLAPIISIFL